MTRLGNVCVKIKTYVKVCLYLQFIGLIMSAPYSNIQFDTKAVQNWEGFWLIFVINFVFHFIYSAISIYQVTFSVVHREVHNKVYPLSAYYLSELMISVCNVHDSHAPRRIKIDNFNKYSHYCPPRSSG